MKAITFSTSRAKRESRRDWAVRKIVEFVDQEFRWAEDVRKRLRHDDEARNHFAGSVNLLRRIRAADPAIVAGAP